MVPIDENIEHTDSESQSRLHNDSDEEDLGRS